MQLLGSLLQGRLERFLNSRTRRAPATDFPRSRHEGCLELSDAGCFFLRLTSAPGLRCLASAPLSTSLVRLQGERLTGVTLFTFSSSSLPSQNGDDNHSSCTENDLHWILRHSRRNGDEHTVAERLEKSSQGRAKLLGEMTEKPREGKMHGNVWAPAHPLKLPGEP